MPDLSVWEKQLSDTFTLIEYPPTLNDPHCSVWRQSATITGKAETMSLFFRTWGIDRQTITHAQCSIIFQAVIEVEIINEISAFTFQEALNWASD